ncbi:MAG: glucose-6-phosphate isomerase, partial [Planctomycetes bacterium]|nr:glucose-6-phosphate isomerase [Planctomycetota bacterium]
VAALQSARKAGQLGFLDLPDGRDALAQVEAYAAARGGRFENVVVLGIGGSALGTLALHAALSPALNNLQRHSHNRPRLFVVDNVDPTLVGGVLRLANPATSVFNVISKSGSTAETMAQLLLFLEALKSALGERWREHVVVTTDAKAGTLRPFAEKNDLPCFTVPGNVGGRFSVLTPVGLLPGALMGWNLRELLAGAAHGRERCLDKDFARNPAALLAVTHWLLDTRARKNVQVLFPYSHRLRMLADWQIQLVAESLGKRTAAGAGVGPTPHKALGATDQHSQVQLFVQGPNDKVFDFVRVERHADDVAIPHAPADLAGLEYLEGRTFGQLLDAECRATYLALVEAGRPCSLTTFPEVDARHVGEWLMWQMCATAYGGLLYGIDAFDQPGVEAGKLATYGLMGRKGYEAEAERIRARQLSDPRWVVG